MTDTTTIEITKEQKNALDDLKASSSESYKDVLARLINDHSVGVSEDEAREIAREVSRNVSRSVFEEKFAQFKNGGRF